MKITKSQLRQIIKEALENEDIDSSGAKPKKMPDGSVEWHLNGKLHRVDGPAVELARGTKQWWQNGKRHRVDGPAWEWASGTKQWYQNGELHRVDGPAIEWADGGKGWWIEGKELTQAEFNKRTKQSKS